MTLTHVDLEPMDLGPLSTVLDAGFEQRFKDRMEQAAKKLGGRTVWNINSTAEGGGVSEMLGTLLPYCLSLGWDVRWTVMFGDDDFFDVTKRVHNALHSAPLSNGGLDERARSVYASTTAANARELEKVVERGDIVLVHDPQAAGLIPPLLSAGAHVSWQSHIGTDEANENTRAAWDFLRPSVASADRYVFSREAYLWDGLDRDRLRVIPPSIDALSAKNMALTDEQAIDILRAAGILSGGDAIEATYVRSDGTTGVVSHRVERVGGPAPLPPEARVVLQVSRWDRLKDPIGCMKIYADHLADADDVHLIHAGPVTNGVDDDPEGATVLEECAELWKTLPTRFSSVFI